MLLGGGIDASFHDGLLGLGAELKIFWFKGARCGPLCKTLVWDLPCKKSKWEFPKIGDPKIVP